MKKIQQGDVLVVEAVIPENAKRVLPKGKKMVLAEGEATGHAHTITATPEVELFEVDGTMYLRVVGESTTVTHEEHAEVTIPQGDYEIGRVVEIDPFHEETRRVSD